MKLVEQAARKMCEADGSKSWDDWPAQVQQTCIWDVRAVLLTILPHLSPESQALLRKELGDG